MLLTSPRTVGTVLFIGVALTLSKPGVSQTQTPTPSASPAASPTPQPPSPHVMPPPQTASSSTPSLGPSQGQSQHKDPKGGEIPDELFSAPASTTPFTSQPEETESATDPDLYVPAGARPALNPSLGLSRDHATARSRSIGGIEYTLDFKLDSAPDGFRGHAQIHFDLRPKWSELTEAEQSKALFLDFEGGEIDSIRINQLTLDPSQLKAAPQNTRYDGHRIKLLPKEVRTGGNEIEINYHHAYSESGHGLHFFKDPEDSRVYTFTDLEPYFANQVFPCFDQPDLKAPFTLKVEAPQDWIVVSNTPELEAPRKSQDFKDTKESKHSKEKQQTTAEGKKLWSFEKSPPLSTYLFALHAGQYHLWKSSASIAITPQEEGGPRQTIPLRLFARKALVKYVNPDEWFNLTRSGLDFFTSFFGTPFSFAKYDQIIAPDMTGAMENPGAVTFSEGFVFRTKTAQTTHRTRATTLLHEMAHMWFGDLVTMRWWSGLWLNESFATFMAVLATERATPFQDAWVHFLANSKRRAYQADQSSTSHPVEVAVRDTAEADGIFDAITYGKGAAVLRQLTHYIGEDDFKEALQRYFNKFSFKTTSKGDFVKVLTEASGQNIDHWQKAWLQTTGMNTLSVSYTCAWDERHRKQHIETFEVKQQGSLLRPRKIQVALYPEKWPAGGKQALTLVDLTLQKPTTPVLEVIRKPCPSAVFPNYNDLDYARIELDPLSRAHLVEHFDKIAEPITRMMLWHYLWNEVLDSRFSVQEYLEVAIKQLPLEKNLILLERVLQTLGSQTTREGTVLKFLSEPKRTQANEAIEKLVLKNLLKAPAGSDVQLVWYQAYLNLAQTPEGLGFLRALLEGKKKIRGIELDQSKRWGLITVLAANSEQQNALKIRKEILAEEKKDPSYLGKKSAAAAIAALPSEENKAAWFEKFTSRSISLPLAREAMAITFPMGQEKQMQAFEDRYFELLKSLSLGNQPESELYLQTAAGYLFPSSCESSVVEKTKLFLAQNPHLSSKTRKLLQNSLEEEGRCVAIKKGTHVPRP